MSSASESANTPAPSPPTPDVDLASVQGLAVLDSTGNKVEFASILSGEGKTVVVFIRHFFCGSCKCYVEDLAAINKQSLLDANVKIVVIGCGSWEPINYYAEETGFPGPIYGDPSLKLFHALGMTIQTRGATPMGQKPKSYLKDGLFMNAAKSIYRGLSHPSLLGKQGDTAQIGGEFIFGAGPDHEVLFFSRMQHTEDHVEIPELMKYAGVTV